MKKSRFLNETESCLNWILPKILASIHNKCKKKLKEKIRKNPLNYKIISLQYRKSFNFTSNSSFDFEFQDHNYLILFDFIHCMDGPWGFVIGFIGFEQSSQQTYFAHKFLSYHFEFI